jgi:hypothetical protein
MTWINGNTSQHRLSARFVGGSRSRRWSPSAPSPRRPTPNGATTIADRTGVGRVLSRPTRGLRLALWLILLRRAGLLRAAGGLRPWHRRQPTGRQHRHSVSSPSLKPRRPAAMTAVSFCPLPDKIGRTKYFPNLARSITLGKFEFAMRRKVFR